MKNFDVWKIREEFCILKKLIEGKQLIYLDSAATTQKPYTVIDIMSRFYQEDYGTVHRAVYELCANATEMYSQVRRNVQRLINAKEEEEIIFTRGTTESINLVAHSFGKKFIKEGDEIIITEMEHHSNIVPWQMLCKEYGIKLKFIPIDEKGELRLDLFDHILTERTKLVSVAHISNTTGTINPIKTIIDKAHAYHAYVLIDGAQAASHMTIDVQGLDADFYVFSGHKMYGPTGVGVLYGKKALLDSIPPFMGGGDMIEEVYMDYSTYQNTPLKFEAGTPSIVEVMGLGAAIDYIEDIGREEINTWKKQLLYYANKKLLEIEGLSIIGTAKEKDSIISFTLDEVHPLDLGTILNLKGIAIRTGHLCAQPTLRAFGVDSLSRLSFGVYNTFQEIDICVQEIKEAISMLRHPNGIRTQSAVLQ